MTEDVSYRQYSGSAAQNYERYFVPTIATPVASHFLAAASLKPGERVLDVACGTGIVARLAAEQVGTEGTVVGTDVAPDMIEVARSTPAPDGAEIEWQEADAASLPFPDGASDVVLCQMGLPFIEDKQAALREMRRVLVPGGRIVVNTPGAVQRLFEHMDEALVRHISPGIGGFVRAVFAMNDPRELDQLLRDAGFQDVDANDTVTTLHLPSPVDFLWQYINLTPMGNFVNPAPDEAKAALERDFADRCQELCEHDGTVTVNQPIVLAAARTS